MGVTFPTTRFGQLDLPPERILTFPQGLIGFAEVRRFALVDNPGGGPFQWLQAVEVPELAFAVTDPRLFFEDYEVPVRAGELRSIGIERIDEGVVVVILVVPRDPRGITANLLGPIVINLRSRLARQIVLDVPGYTTRHRLFPDEAEPRAEPAAERKGAAC
jgi:flagellar assembly factor FliW